MTMMKRGLICLHHRQPLDENGPHVIPSNGHHMVFSIQRNRRDDLQHAADKAAGSQDLKNDSSQLSVFMIAEHTIIGIP